MNYHSDSLFLELPRFFQFGSNEGSIRLTQNLFSLKAGPIDAGTDNGFTFTSPNWPTSPQASMFEITNEIPPHPAGSFHYPDKKSLPPIATFTFVKEKEYELSEVFNFNLAKKRRNPKNVGRDDEDEAMVDLNSKTKANKYSYEVDNNKIRAKYCHAWSWYTQK